MFHKCLTIEEKALWKVHLHTANTYNKIGLLMYDKGDLDRALELDMFHKCLAIREKVLGKSHPDTARTYNNINYVKALLTN